MDQHLNIVISGDLSAELIDLVTENLKKSVGRNISIQFMPESQEGYAIPVEDFLAAAAAIATILDFLLNVGKTWVEYRNRAEDEVQIASEIDSRLKSVTSGFEVQSVEIDKSSNEKTISHVNIYDVPNRSTIEVVRESESNFHISYKSKKESGPLSGGSNEPVRK